MAGEVGKKFGRWTLIAPADPKGQKWKVRCDCGTEAVRLLTKMVNGVTRSCGCARAQYHSRLIGVALQKRGA